jgi:hypothetical protein
MGAWPYKGQNHVEPMGTGVRIDIHSNDDTMGTVVRIVGLYPECG